MPSVTARSLPVENPHHVLKLATNMLAHGCDPQSQVHLSSIHLRSTGSKPVGLDCHVGNLLAGRMAVGVPNAVSH